LLIWVAASPEADKETGREDKETRRQGDKEKDEQEGDETTEL
jgi:hypothetical protein